MKLKLRLNELEIEVYEGDQLIYRSISKKRVDKFIHDRALLNEAPEGMIHIKRAGTLIMGFDLRNDVYVILQQVHDKYQVVDYNKDRVLIEETWEGRTK
jgi:hypothetical protein